MDGLGQNACVQGPDGTPVVQRITQATASWGVHVKHLKNLIAEYNTGVMEADKRYRIPIDAALLQVPATGKNMQNTAQIAGSLTSSVSNAANPQVAHQIQMSIGNNGGMTGTSNWPSNESGGVRQFALSGTLDANGRFEVTDNTPELFPGFRRGLNIGTINPASRAVQGEYYEYNEVLDETYYVGDFSGQLQ